MFGLHIQRMNLTSTGTKEMESGGLMDLMEMECGLYPSHAPPAHGWSSISKTGSTQSAPMVMTFRSIAAI